MINGTSYNERYDLPGERHRSLRKVEFETHRLINDGGASFVSIDMREKSQIIAVINIVKTLFICAVLGIGSLMFR